MDKSKTSTELLLTRLMKLAGVETLQTLLQKTLTVSQLDGTLLLASTIATVLPLRNGVRLETTGGDALEVFLAADGQPKGQIILLPRFYTNHALAITGTENNAIWIDRRIIFNDRGMA